MPVATRILRSGLVAVVLLIGLGVGQIAHAASAADIDRKAEAGLASLLASDEAARLLAKEARAILVFPSIVKGGFVVGGQFGDGALRRGGKTVAYYRSVAASYGLQAGVFTRDLYKAMRAWDVLEVGGVVVGDVPSFRVDHMPYGGVKDSGLGREGIRYAMEEMTELRLLVIRERG